MLRADTRTGTGDCFCEPHDDIASRAATASATRVDGGSAGKRSRIRKVSEAVLTVRARTEPRGPRVLAAAARDSSGLCGAAEPEDRARLAATALLEASIDSGPNGVPTLTREQSAVAYLVAAGVTPAR